MNTIIKKYHFYAAHRNKNADEKCGRIHGHTYQVQMTFNTGSVSKETGISILFGSIDKLVEPIIKEHCHYFLLYEKDPLCDVLNTVNEPYLELPFETSLENLAVWLFTRVKNETNLPITKIEIAETLSSKVTYEP